MMKSITSWLIRKGWLRDKTWDHLHSEAVELEKNPPEPIDHTEWQNKHNEELRKEIWKHHKGGPVIDYRNFKTEYDKLVEEQIQEQEKLAKIIHD